MNILVFLLAHLMGHNPGASSSGTRRLFLECHATLGFHLHTLLGVEKILRVAAEKCAVDSNLLALLVHPPDRLIGAESDVTPVQARELFIVVEIILTLDYGGKVSGLAFPFDGHYALDETRANGNERFHKVLYRPFPGKASAGKSRVVKVPWRPVVLSKMMSWKLMKWAPLLKTYLRCTYSRLCEPLELSFTYGVDQQKFTEESRWFEEISGALFVPGVTWVANDEMNGEDFGIEGKIMVQL